MRNAVVWRDERKEAGKDKEQLLQTAGAAAAASNGDGEWQDWRTAFSAIMQVD